jgi:ATP-binding cassette subfamily F protein uup
MDQARSQIRDGLKLREFLCPDGDSIVYGGESIHVVAWAARFLFSHNHLARDLAALSGGEKARAILAKSMSQRADVLVFDEPTNDLDIGTLENLEEGFASFPGAIVLITHDRYLLDRSASMVLGLAGGQAGMFGSYAQWEAHRNEHRRSESKAADERLRRSSQGGTGGEAAVGSSSGKATKRLSYKDARDLSMIEELISKAEERVAETQRQIDSGEYSTDASKLTQLCETLTVQQQEVERLYARWQELELLSSGS